MMKQIIWGLSFLIILVVGVFIYVVTSDGAFDMGKQEQKASATPVDYVEEAENQEVEKEQKVEVQSKIDTNPFDDSVLIEELNDSHYQKYIHGMAHQKVKASEKWGFYLITEERIQWLLDGLEVADLKHDDLYRDILGRWAEGDFSSVDQDHNRIWDLQNGTIGKATGILSPEEEQAYIKSQQ